MILVVLMLLIVVGLIVVFFAVIFQLRSREETSTEVTWEFANMYQRKPYLFDATSEYNLFGVLNEFFSDRYHIFPQVNLSHLVEPKPMPFHEYRKFRSKIDKKSADFVLCDKQRVIPRLVIELDGNSHNRADRVQRDEFVESLMKHVDLPLLRIRLGSVDREGVRAAVENALKRINFSN